MNKKNMIQAMMVLFLMSSIPLASYGVLKDGCRSLYGGVEHFGISHKEFPKAFITLRMEKNPPHDNAPYDNAMYLKPGEKSYTFYLANDNVAYKDILYVAGIAYALKKEVTLIVQKDDNVKAIYLSK